MNKINSDNTMANLKYTSILIYCSLHDESLFGPLTQRLVSALIEENIMTPLDDEMEEMNTESGT